MVYKNFILRVLFTLLFILTYFIISIVNFNLVIFLILVIYLLILIEVYYNFVKYKILIISYILVSLIFFFTINFSNNIFLSFNLFIFIVITFDIFSYIIGKLFGKNKLVKISPNKTIEGLMGGIIFSFILSLIFLSVLDINIDINLIVFIFITIISAFLGDLIESFFKRKNNLKNSSELIPGHGGVFDRFDSFLFSIIFYSISIKFLL